MIKPYYETELGKLYHGECLPIMKTFPDCSIDTIITDPPYALSDKNISKRIENERKQSKMF